MSGIQRIIATVTLTTGRQLTVEQHTNIPGTETLDAVRAALKHVCTLLDEAAEQELTGCYPASRGARTWQGRHDTTSAATEIIQVVR